MLHVRLSSRFFFIPFYFKILILAILPPRTILFCSREGWGKEGESHA